MILQELIRNIVLYKGVVKPFLYSWRQSFHALYAKKESSSLYSRALLQRIKAKKHSDMFILAGQKITNTSTLSYLVLKSKEKTIISNDACITLRGSMVYEKVVRTTKSYIQSFSATWIQPVVVSSETADTAIGFSIERTYFLITETHERREYLGEFSLTRDETLLINLKGGGEYI